MTTVRTCNFRRRPVDHFDNEDGFPISPLLREFDRRVTRWGLPKLTVHTLRHGRASTAREAGVHPGVVQERLGISTIGVVLGTYSHVSRRLHDEAAEFVATRLMSDR